MTALASEDFVQDTVTPAVFSVQRRCCLSFFEELKRRNVFRVGIAHGVSAWVLLQFADLVLDNI